MRVLLTGASGTIGEAILRSLVEHGHDVVAVRRAPGGSTGSQVEERVADLYEPGALRQVAEGVDAAVHAASSNDERAGALDRSVVSDLLDAFAGTGKALVYTSGLWLHGSSGDGPIREESPLAPPAVVAWRPAIEELVAGGAAGGVRTVRIRPALVHGHGRGYVPWVLGVHPGPVVRIFGTGANRWSTVHVDDLADLYVRAVESAPAGSVYLGASERQSVRVAEIAQAVADRAGARVESWKADDAERTWGVMQEPFLLDQVASGEKAYRELGWLPKRPGVLDDLNAR
ncbi:NAD-dependent epimerase/dehydratase family protein [Pseudonocardia sp. TRM90224]|uniref:NAD-dependent epimerase/dehydratase family protein n=1 Tax=Pseudonocardia sp. TRM90224 TaxID=2812678 RepID=UPI001E3481DE|nr:NAD-dependent epimerase/dehydratase family protein [Pseudonocardia sp. TRM90224]